MSSEPTLVDIWDNPARQWPSVAYIETTNQCNAKCLCCLNDRCQKPRGTMTMEAFAAIVDRLSERRLPIGAMFCFGEPLLDPTLFQKYKYAIGTGILNVAHCGLNTNVSHLTPEKYDGILQHTPNITLSFFNTGKEYERLTGLDWENSYRNAMDFIAYRDKHSPGYPIAIGVNTVEGHNLENVQRAFAGQAVRWARDREVRWGGSVITGVIDRTIMYRHWRCDGYKGALQVKHDGSCEFCAFDVVGTPEGGETYVGDILTDSWETLESNFRKKWRSKCSLCIRCDYWHCAKQVFDNNFTRPDPLPENWYDWQNPFLKEGETPVD